MKNVNILNILKYFCLLANTLEVNVLLNQYVTQVKLKHKIFFTMKISKIQIFVILELSQFLTFFVLKFFKYLNFRAKNGLAKRAGISNIRNPDSNLNNSYTFYALIFQDI